MKDQKIKNVFVIMILLHYGVFHIFNRMNKIIVDFLISLSDDKAVMLETLFSIHT
jgi:hypothetical protein